MQDVQRDKAAAVAEGTAVRAAGIGIAPDWLAWARRRRAEVDQALHDHLRAVEGSIGTHSRLGEAVLYSVQAGGKRLRPILVLETCAVCGGRAEAAMPAAIAMELIHTFSLIHDDLPAMDDDDLRRGKPTNHKVFGEALALLAGDWLLTHAFMLLASDRVGRGVLPGVLAALGQGTQEMIAGQAADVAGEGQPPSAERVRYIHRHKTAALIEACCRLGGLCAEASSETVTALARYGRHVGQSFQIADDLLDARGSEAQVGKRLGKDAAVAKQTYPAVFGLEASEARAREEMELALKALESFGGRADRLRDLARYVVGRDH